MKGSGVPTLVQWDWWHVGSTKSQVQSPALWVKDPGLPQLWLRLQLQLRSDLWPPNSTCCAASKKGKKKNEGIGCRKEAKGSSHCGSVVTNLTSTHEDLGLIPGPLSGLRIWHCRELCCRSQTWLGSHVAVAVV